MIGYFVEGETLGHCDQASAQREAAWLQCHVTGTVHAVETDRAHMCYAYGPNPVVRRGESCQEDA